MEKLYRLYRGVTWSAAN